MNNQIDVKLILVGTQSVGKTCIVQKLVTGKFSEDERPTLGAAYFPMSINIGNKEVRLQIWDTAGQERYRGMTPMYYRDAKVALIVYSVGSSDSFKEVEDWYDSLRNHADSNIQIYLVGNKIDLDDQEVSQEEGEKKAKDIGAFFYSVSAKTGEGVLDMFNDIAKAAINADSQPKTSTETKINLNDKNPKQSKKCC